MRMYGAIDQSTGPERSFSILHRSSCWLETSQVPPKEDADMEQVGHNYDLNWHQEC